MRCADACRICCNAARMNQRVPLGTKGITNTGIGLPFG